MSIDGDYTNVGIAAIHESNPATSVGPYVTTGNYCHAETYYANHFNQFIVGTVWTDANSNNQYDPGEGKANVKVTPNHGTYFAVTGNSGGYAIPASNGAYSVTFSGGSLSKSYLKSVTVNGKSALLDLEANHGSGTNNVIMAPILYLLQ